MASYSDVEKALGREDYSKARELTDAILQTGLPQERDRLLPLYPRLLLGLGKVEEARACIQKLSGAEQGAGRKGKASTPTASVLSGEQLAIYRAWLASLEGKRDQGVRELEKMLEQAGESPSETLAEAAEILSQLYLQQGDTEKAQKVVDLGLKILQYRGASGYLLPLLKNRMTSQAQRLFNQAENLRKAGKFSEAIPVYRQVQTKFPKDPLVHPSGLYIGECLWRMDRAEEAAAHWKKFVKTAPMGPFRGQAMVALCDLALQTDLDLAQASAYSMTAAATLSKGVDVQAEPSWREASFDIYTHLGVVSLVEHRYEAAAQAFENAKLAKESQGTAAKPLSPEVQAGLDRLIEAAQKRSALVPEEFEGLGDPKAVTALALGGLFHVLHQYDLAQEYFAIPLIGLQRSKTSAHRSFAGMGLARAIAASERSGGKATSSSLLDKLRTGGNRKPAAPAKRTSSPAPSPSVFSQVESLCKASLEEYPRGSWRDETLYCLTTAIENHAEAVAVKQQKPTTAKAKPEAAAPRAADPVRAVAADAKAQKDRMAALMKLKQEALPYYEEILTKYPKSPHREAAAYHAAVLRCGLADVALPSKAEALWQEADAALHRFTKEFPKSPYAGAAFVRRMDIALEQLFDPKIALAVNKEAGAWARWAIGAPALESPKAAAWAIVEKYPEQKALRHDVYDCLLRLGLVAYLIGDYKAAAEWIDIAGPKPPPKGFSADLDMDVTTLYYLLKAVRGGKSVAESDGLEAAKTDAQRLLVQLGDLYLYTVRPDKAEKVFLRVFDPNAKLGKVPPGLEAYAMIRIAAAVDRQEGRSSEALVWLTRLAARPDLHGTYWHGSGLFYLALFTYNQTQDSKQSMPLYEAMLRQYPDHALAERALLYYGLDAIQLKDKKAAVKASQEFFAKYPKSRFRPVLQQQLDTLNRSSSDKNNTR